MANIIGIICGLYLQYIHFLYTDVDNTNCFLCAPNHPQSTTITIGLAPEHHSSFDSCPSSAQLCLHDLCHIAALQSVTGEGMAVDICQEISSIFDLTSTDQLEFVVNCLQSSIMTKEKNFTKTDSLLIVHIIKLADVGFSL